MEFNPNWHKAGRIYPLTIFGLDFVSWIFIKNFQTFLEMKIEINRDNSTPCQAHWVLLNLLLGGAKDEHFSYFHSSCQLGFRSWIQTNAQHDLKKFMIGLFIYNLGMYVATKKIHIFLYALQNNLDILNRQQNLLFWTSP